jgi:hypothetical protein
MKKIFCLILTALTFSLFANSQVPMPPISGNNPYDYIGISHNSTLQSFFSEYTAERVRDEKLSLKEVYDYVIQKSGIKEKDIAENILNQPVFLSCRRTTFTDLPNKLEQMNVISVNCGKYLRSIDAAIENDLEAGFETFNNSTLLLENNIMDDKGLSEMEKGILLCTASTARHSAFFWKEFAENMDSKAKGSGSSAKLPGWLRAILRADASGAGGGAVAGGIAGGLAGMGIGALAGGAGNSTTNAIEQLWDWLF